MPDILSVNSGWSAAERVAALPAEAGGRRGRQPAAVAAPGAAARSRRELSSAHSAS